MFKICEEPPYALYLFLLESINPFSQGVTLPRSPCPDSGRLLESMKQRWVIVLGKGLKFVPRSNVIKVFHLLFCYNLQH